MKSVRQTLRRKSAYGFTLVELLVAVTVLVTAVGAPLLLAARGVELAVFAKNRIAAIQLAQEGIEYIKNMRDSNIKKIINGPSVNWYDGFWNDGVNGAPDCTTGSGGCIIDVFNDTVTECTGLCPKLEYEAAGGERLFGHDGPILIYSQESLFRRMVTVDQISGEEMAVAVTVEWEDKNKPKSISVSEHIYSWGQ